MTHHEELHPHQSEKLKLFPVLLFIVFLFLRLVYASTHISFSQDQARDALYMKRFAAEKQILVGYGPKASVGNFYLPPFYYQLHYFFSTFSNQNPLIMQIITTIVESATPVLLFLLLQLFVNKKSACIGAVAYFLFLLPTVFGTIAWNPNMIPFFSTLAAYCWFKVLFTQEKWPILVGCVALTIAFHLHYQAFVLFPFAAVVMVTSLKRNIKDLKWWLIGAFASMLIFAPYIRAEAGNNWKNTNEIYTYFTQEHSRYFDRVSKIGFVATFLPAFTEKVLFNQYLFPQQYWIGRVLFLGGFLSLCIASLKSKKWRWILLYFITVLAMLRVYRGDKLEYYLSTLYIMPAFFFAIWWRIFKPFVLICVIVLAFFAGKFYMSNISTDQVRAVEQIAEHIEKETNGQPFSLLIHNDDFVNIFAYVLADDARFIFYPGTSVLIEICQFGKHCQWDGNLVCRASRSYTYASLLKIQSGYMEKSVREFGNRYVVNVGTMSKPTPNIGYPLYVTTHDYGSDEALHGLYKE
jgi:4-amino-4-deoxy-L-arabinose transferase-like glycosyltransferase